MEIITIINKGDLVFDVGCNAGDKAATYLDRGASVVGFEPQHDCANYCGRRFEGKKFVVEQVALDEVKGQSILWKANAHTISSMSRDFIDTVKKERFKDYSWNEEVFINTETLDSMIVKYGKPHYIKIDVEGFELNVLKGLTCPIAYISIEFTPELVEKTIQCLDYLGQGKIYNYGSQNSTEFFFKDWIDKETLVKFLKDIKDYKVEFGDVYIKTP